MISSVGQVTQRSLKCQLSRDLYSRILKEEELSESYGAIRVQVPRAPGLILRLLSHIMELPDNYQFDRRLWRQLYVLKHCVGAESKSPKMKIIEVLIGAHLRGMTGMKSRSAELVKPTISQVVHPQIQVPAHHPRRAQCFHQEQSGAHLHQDPRE